MSVRTLRVLEGQLQTVRARVIEAEIELTDALEGGPPTPATRRAAELLELADDDLRSLLDLVREATTSRRGL